MGQAVSTNLQVTWEPLSQGPGLREGSALWAPGQGQVFLFGGNGADGVQYRDMWHYRDAQWRPLAAEGPSARAGAATATAGGVLWLFGGLDADDTTGGWQADLWGYDVATGQWHQVVAPHGPSARDKACAVAAGANVLVFGGFGPVDEPDTSGGEELGDELDQDIDDAEAAADEMGPAKFRWFNDLHVWNLTRSEWRRVPCETSPSVRAAHTMGIMQGRVWVCGGRTSAGREADLWSCAVQDVLSATDEAPLVWTQAVVEPCIMPVGRSFHAMGCTSDAGRALVFGGVDNGDTVLADVHVFDMNLRAWAQPVAVNCMPAPRGFMASACDGEHFYIYGGSDGAASKIFGDFHRVALEPVRSAHMAPPQEQQQQTNK